MLYTICYDIADNRRRRKLEKLLKGYGIRVQESVFEAHLSDKLLLALRGKVLCRIDPDLDTVRFYPLCERCRAGAEVHGLGPAVQETPLSAVVV